MCYPVCGMIHRKGFAANRKEWPKKKLQPVSCFVVFITCPRHITVNRTWGVRRVNG